MHTNFILSDISELLDDAIASASALRCNISHFPLCEYLLQSIFLRLTGYQEQKLKCILWELASDDFSFRYKYLNGTISVGECSRLEDKNKVYMELKTLLDENGHSFPFPNETDVNELISNIKFDIQAKFGSSMFVKCLPRDYSRFLEFSNKLQYLSNGYFTSSGIFGGDNILKEAFEKNYRHRNRCAHNLLSYQNNVPTLHDLTKDGDGSDNYFSRILLIFMIDNVFTHMFRYYSAKTRSI